MIKEEQRKLYYDALYSHYVDRGDPDWMAKAKAENIMANWEES